MTVLPTGTVTFLLTDIEGSTRLFQQGPEAFGDAIAMFSPLGSRLEHARAIHQRAELGLARGDASEAQLIVSGTLR